MSESNLSNMELAKRASGSLVASDAVLFCQIVANPALEHIRPTLISSLSPMISMFIVESGLWAGRNNLPRENYPVEFQTELTASRQRVKGLVSNKRSMAEIESQYFEISRICSAWFKAMHTGWKGLLVRRFQQDFGMTFIDHKVVSTIHVDFLNTGIPFGSEGGKIGGLTDFGKYGFTIGYAWGAYFGWLIETLQLSRYMDGTRSNVDLPKIGYSDYYIKQLERQISTRIAPNRPSLFLTLSSILSQVNTALCLLPLIATSDLIATTKWKFVILFQAIRGIELIRNEHFRTDRFLTRDGLECVSEILCNCSIVAARNQARLRNVLVHYDLGPGEASRLVETSPLWGLLGACSEWVSWSEALVSWELGLACISDRLQELLFPDFAPKHFH